MKIAVASTGHNLDSDVSPIFGRSSTFVIADLEEGKIKDMLTIENPRKIVDFSGIEIINFDNPSKNETGAGNTAAHFIVNHEVNALISGKLGPVAFHILKNAGIKMYKATSGSIEKNLKRFIEDKLEEITSLSGGFPV